MRRTEGADRGTGNPLSRNLCLVSSPMVSCHGMGGGLTHTLTKETEETVTLTEETLRGETRH